MKKVALNIILILLLLIISPTKNVLAYAEAYQINNFESDIKINQNTSLTITEKIQVTFNQPRHGIFRIIPIIYTVKGKTLKTDLHLISVTDENNNPYIYSSSHYKQSIKIKIGDPERTITGNHTYLIKYKVKDVLQRYDDSDELYWNALGHEWDTTIKKASVTVSSPYAEIEKVNCFAGEFGSKEKSCTEKFSKDKAKFFSTKQLGWGKDFTIVIALKKNNSLKFPGITEKTIKTILNNWGYLPALFPLMVIIFFWYKKGRDKRYLTDNFYYKPKNEKTKDVSLFERKYLPMVYHPIKNLSPAAVGTIIDEKVDIQDVVAEIIELAHLGFLKIERIKKKGFLKRKNDYSFTKLKKKRKLKDYQKYLLTKLFEESTDDKMLLSDLKNKFYKHLDVFKKKLYQNLADEKIFDGNPEKVRMKWLSIFITLIIFSFMPLISFSAATSNSFPIILLASTIIPGIILSRSMPRRTAWGYSLFRQIKGLRWYLKKGKWRHEINEKHLFIEEILPLAISLGVINKLAKDMKDLNIKPPSYFQDATTANLPLFIQDFRTSTSKTLVSTPRSARSGRSSWSGGSGFSGGSSGGFSGGGFGGGGGGSW